MVAGALIRRFGSLARVVSASVEQLNEVSGEERIGLFIHAARTMVEVAFREDLSSAPVTGLSRELGLYLRSLFGDCRNEQMHAIFLDGQRRYIGDEMVGEGRHTDVVLQGRRLLSRAFELNAVNMIVAHNHPSGDCRPSEQDVIATKRLRELCSAVDITLLDHIIVTKCSCYSMKSNDNF